MENWEAGEGEGNYYTPIESRRRALPLGENWMGQKVWNQTYMVFVFRYYIITYNK